MKIIFTLLTSIFTSSIIAQIPSFEWAVHMGGGDEDLAYSITSDANGNTYTIGIFKDTVDFDPGTGTTTLYSNGNWDIFIQKLSPNGDLLWVKQIGGIGRDEGLSIALDNVGNVYATGEFFGQVDFDPGSGNIMLTAPPHRHNGFILKLNPDGNFLWAKQHGCSSTSTSHDLHYDALGAVYAIGHFQDTLDVDPGPNVVNFINTTGYHDCFIQKLDTDGNLVWAKQVSGSFQVSGYSITSDDQGNVIASGTFEGSADLDPGNGTSIHISTNHDMFMLKLDSFGDYLWAKSMSGPEHERIYSMVVDANGNVFSSGIFEDTVDFDSGPGIAELISKGDFDGFIQKLDSDGNFVWVNQIGGMGIDWNIDITKEESGEIYCIGSFSDSVDFDPSSSILTLISEGLRDIFITKYNTDGDLIWVNQFGGTDDDSGISISLDASGNIYSAGGFSGICDFFPGTGVANLTSNGGFDIFVHKLGVNQTSTAQDIFKEKVQVYPNPTSGMFTIEFENTKEIFEVRLLSISGQLLYTEMGVNTATHQFDLNIPSGVYLIELSSEGKTQQYKLVKK